MKSFIYQPADGGHGTGAYCKCCRFTRGLDLPSPRELTLEEIKVEARRFSARVLGNWCKLNACIKRFEPLIQKRWLKKTFKQRQIILLKAWPEISRNHRPDFVGARNRLKQRAPARTRQSQAFLWPYINVDDLQQDHLLLLFLRSRGRYLPDTFVAMDLENTHRGHGWPVQSAADEAGMEFMGQRTPGKYGQIITNIPAKDTAAAAAAAANDRPVTTYPPIVGLFILEVQDGIYTFLLECCKTILHDVAPTAWILSPSQPAPPLPTPDRKSSQWSSTPALALETPYREPQRFDLERFRFIIAAKREAAVDHICYLREDPGYFVDTWVETRHHDIDLLHFDDSDNVMWAHVAGLMISDAFNVFWLWHNLLSAFAFFAPIDVQLRNRGNPIHRDAAFVDDMLWTWIDNILKDYVWKPRHALLHGVFASPKIRPSTDFSNMGGATGMFGPKTNCSDAEYRVQVLFGSLCNEEQSNLHGIQHIVQETQNMIDSDPEASNLVDSWVSSKFSDFALLVQLQREVTGFQPWPNRWNQFTSLNPLVRANVTSFLDRDYDAAERLFDAPAISILDLGSPLDDKWNYPVERKRTKETTEQLRRAEEQLKGFWKSVDDYFERGLGIPPCQYHGLGVDIRPRPHKTKPWVEPPRENGIPSPQPSSALNGRPIAAVHPLGSENKKRELRDNTDASKAKVKTRGSTTRSDTPPDQQDELEVQNPELSAPPRIVVSKRAARVFDILFPSAKSISHVGKEISWEDLLNAMNDIGLRPEKLYGSVWIFRPLPKDERKVQVNRSIQFHEPKEVRRGSKIPPFKVKLFGRRLNRVYGWETGMFVCA